LANNFTKTNFEVWLREKWASLDVSLDDSGRLGLSVSEIVGHSYQRASQENDPHFDLWIAIFDELVSWLISVESVWRHGVVEKTSPTTSFEKSISVLLARLIADSLAIRQLMISGFNTSAQVLVRSAAEHMEVLVAIIDDRAVAKAFETTKTPEDANRFWKSYISNNKLRPRIKSVWMEFFGGDRGPAKAFANWGSAFYDELCAISHPSFFGCGGAMLSTKSVLYDGWPAMLGDRSLSSIGTIQTYISYFFPLILAIGDFPFIPSSNQNEISISYDNKAELHQHIHKGRSVLGSLIVSLNFEPNFEYILPDENVS
jgi:hypothetical protein